MTGNAGNSSISAFSADGTNLATPASPTADNSDTLRFSNLAAKRFVGFDDLIWNYGEVSLLRETTGGTSAGSWAMVPEPSSLLLLASGLTLAGCRRRPEDSR